MGGRLKETLNSHRPLLFCNLEVGEGRLPYSHQSLQQQKYRIIGRTQHIVFLLPSTHSVCHRKTRASIKFHSAGHSPFPNVVTIPFTPIFLARRSSPWTSCMLVLTIGFQTSTFPLSLRSVSRGHWLCTELPLLSLLSEAQGNHRTGHLWVSPMQKGMGGYGGTEQGEPMVIATERKEQTPGEYKSQEALLRPTGQLCGEQGSSPSLRALSPRLLCAFLKLRFPESLRCPGMGRRCPHPQVAPSPSIPSPPQSE